MAVSLSRITVNEILMPPPITQFFPEVFFSVVAKSENNVCDDEMQVANKSC